MAEMVEKILAHPEEDRVDALKYYCNLVPELKAILGVQYNPDYQFDLPKIMGVPKRRHPVPAGTGVKLAKEMRTFPMFLKFQDQPMRDLKIERKGSLFLQLLESVDDGEFEILQKLRNKEFTDISLETVMTAFPDLLESANSGGDVA
jgi:hypothetical protein